MDLEIEVGTDEQKAQIANELESFANGVSASADFTVQKIIIPLDFDAAVNGLQGTTSYRSRRPGQSITAAAKYVQSGTDVSIVLAPVLYSDKNDTQTRFFIFMHEICHVINRTRFPHHNERLSAEGTDFYNLYALYDEYLADLHAFDATDAVFPDKTAIWNRSIQETIKGFSEIALDKSYYEYIRGEIAVFRVGSDLNRLLSSVTTVFDIVALSLAHLYPAIDYSHTEIGTLDLNKSPFVNYATSDLMTLFKSKSANRQYDIDNNEDKIIAFMQNFGVRFENNQQGIYCHVLDI